MCHLRQLYKIRINFKEIEAYNYIFEKETPTQKEYYLSWPRLILVISKLLKILSYLT